MKTIVLTLLILTACSDAEGTRDVLRNEGYSNIETSGHSWRGCSQHDTYCTEFRATGPTGRELHGVVGCGVSWGGKGCTVRVFR